MRFSGSLLLILFALVCQLSNAQDLKVEEEERVSLSEVPETSINWLNAVFPSNQKIKWYRESTSGKTSFEAKFKYKTKKYSVEFSEEGAFEDIEFIVNWKSLNEDLKKHLLNLLDDFQKIKVKKLQKQWTGISQEALKDAIRNQDPSQITERYEIVFQAKKEGKYHIWEALLSMDRLIRVQEVKLRSTANLDF